ncbi:hypothetical protein ACWDA3_09645 [Nonomuraea rubra]
MAVIAAAAMPVTRERLTRFASALGLSVTAANARQIVDHVTDLRRRRLICVAVAAPLSFWTGDPFYLVLGWCASYVFSDKRARLAAEVEIHRTTWLLTLGAATLAGGYRLINQGVTAALLIHAAAVIAVAVVMSRPARPYVAHREPAILRASARNAYSAASAIALSGALLAPGPVPERELPEYTTPVPLATHAATFDTVGEFKGPTCPWADQLDDPCRHWLVNGEPFPQAAPYVVGKGGAPVRAPFVRSPDKRAVVYLHRQERRLVHQKGDDVRPLTGALADSEVPEVTFATGQSRQVALSGHDVRVLDLDDGTTRVIPGARQVHDFNSGGIVVETASRIVVLDRQGRERGGFPVKELGDADSYHLRRDGRRLVTFQLYEGLTETYDTRTGERLSSVVLDFPGDDSPDTALGWTKQGTFLVRGTADDVYRVDLTTGKLKLRP